MENNSECAKSEVAQTAKSSQGFSLRERISLSLLAAFALSYTVLFHGAYEIFISNRQELGFYLGDFFLPLLLIVLLATMVIAAATAFIRGRAYTVAFAILLYLTFMSYLQGNFLNFGVNSLVSDDVGTAMKTWQVILDLFLWVAIGVAFLLVVKHPKTREWVKTGGVFVLSLLLAMQIGSALITGITQNAFGDPPTNSDSEVQDTKNAQGILSDKGIYDVSEGNIILVFIIDRFDATFYQDIVAADPTYFDDLDGFTYYTDNISLYSRTYPAVASIITGVRQDFTSGAKAYFQKAYTTSPFLQDLQANGYKIGLYIDDYYTYRNAGVFADICDNYTPVTGYEIDNRFALVGNMILLSLYRYAPLSVKRYISISSTSFDGVVKYSGEYNQYQPTDAQIYQDLLESGVTVSGEENTFRFIHLNGCHNPYAIDENGNAEDNGVVSAAKGCFLLIREYLEQLKAAGLYDNATVVITGDHGSAYDDCIKPWQPRQTALFVKQRGQTGALTYSNAQVSQENLLAELVKSAQIQTEHDYGDAYSDIAEGETRTRIHMFEMTSPITWEESILTYEITGKGSDFDNWKLIDEEPIGELYR